MTEDFNRQEEMSMIAAAIAIGKMKRYPMGYTSDFDNLPFEVRRQFVNGGVWKKREAQDDAR